MFPSPFRLWVRALTIIGSGRQSFGHDAPGIVRQNAEDRNDFSVVGCCGR